MEYKNTIRTPTIKNIFEKIDIEETQHEYEYGDNTEQTRAEELYEEHDDDINYIKGGIHEKDKSNTDQVAQEKSKKSRSFYIPGWIE